MTRLEVEFIAEVAQGCEGNLQQGMLLLEAAISSGADSVKFQLIIADEICTPDYKYYNLFKSLEMPLRHWIKLAKRAESADVSLIVDIFGQRSLTFAKKMGVETPTQGSNKVGLAVADARDLLLRHLA